MEDQISENFERFHADNPEVFRHFCRFTFQMVGAGLQHGSAKLVFERIRWEMALARPADPVKLNNNYTSRYARLFEEAHPDLAGFFRKRKLRDKSADSVHRADPYFQEQGDPNG